MKNINNAPIQRKNKGADPNTLMSSMAEKAQQTDLNTTNTNVSTNTSQLNTRFSPNSIGVFATVINEADLPSIKNLGCNYILYINSDTNTTNVVNKINLCAQYGLNVLLSVEPQFQTNDDTNAQAIITATKSLPNVIGFYVLDEPDLNNISITRQQQVQSLTRAITSLPVFTSVTISSSSPVIDTGFDYYFVNSYFTSQNYSDINAANTTVFNISASRLVSVAGYVGIEKCIPTVGFFTDNASFGVTNQDFLFNANRLTLGLYKNNGFAMFVWGTFSTSTNTLSTSTTFYNNALRFAKISGMIPKGTTTYHTTGLYSTDPLGTKINRMVSAYSPLSTSITYGANPKSWPHTGFYFQEGSVLVIDLGKLAKNVYLQLRTIDGSGLGVHFSIFAGINGDETAIYTTSATTESITKQINNVNTRYIRITTTGLAGTTNTKLGYVVVEDLAFVAQ